MLGMPGWHHLGMIPPPAIPGQPDLLGPADLLGEPGA
jgi:hypothetical protein